MKEKLLKVLLAVLALLVIAVLVFRANPKHEIIRDAYIYVYPLVTFDLAGRQQTTVERPDDQHAPMGQVIKMRSYPAVDNKCCAAPNTDTLSTIVGLDVAQEPWMVSIPDMGDRYFIVPFHDGWSEVFHVASPATTGSKAQTYAVTGPGWTGTLPAGVTQIKSPTAMVWMLGRIYCTGTLEDYGKVHALQDQFASVPLRAYGKPYVPAPAPVDAKFDMITGVRKQVNGLSLADYFTRLAELLKTNPPKPENAPLVAQLAKIGIVPGQDFDRSKLPVVGQSLDPKLSVVEMGLNLKRQHTTYSWLFFTQGGERSWGVCFERPRQGLAGFARCSPFTLLPSVEKSGCSSKEANWLPAPATSPFNLVVRIFRPKESARDGTWPMPGMKLVS